MRDPSLRAPFDQGIFLAHFNKGKDLFDERRFEEAERELEEAYLLRPRDQKVLNLLGLVYFKQEKYEKAEEVYRKLAAESPEAHTLYYNLGLIYFKLNRLDEAEAMFLKALDLARENPKINFYLGSIYERLHRFPDAIYQYRKAGANIMVRRVEDKMAAVGPRPVPIPGAHRPGDTAEFKAREVRELLRRNVEPSASPEKTLRPVSPDLMAHEPAAPINTADTARLRVPEVFRSPPPTTGRFPEMISFATKAPSPPSAPEHGPGLRPRRATDIFRFLENNLMEINVSGKVFIRQGTIYSYGGNLTFWVKDPRPGGSPGLVIITGVGKVILTGKDREITFLQVEDETLHIEPSHLLACEDTLTPSYVPVGNASPALEFFSLSGRGMVALSVASRPLVLEVTPELPVSVPAASIISWSGVVIPRLLEDRQLYEVMLPTPGRAGTLIRLEGTGRVLVEQALS